MYQTIFDTFHRPRYDSESSTFATDSFSDKAWPSDDLTAYWGSPACDVIAGGASGGENWGENFDASPLVADTADDGEPILQDGCHKMTDTAAGCIMDAAWKDMFRGVVDIDGFVGKHLTFPCNENCDDTLDVVVHNDDEGVFEAFTSALTPPMDDADGVWGSPTEPSWMTASAITMDTEDRVQQLLARVDDMGASMEELGAARDSSDGISRSLTEETTAKLVDSYFNFAEEDDDDEDEDVDVGFNNDAMLSAEKGPCEDTIDVKPIVVKPARCNFLTICDDDNDDDDDESEEVDIMSIMEERCPSEDRTVNDNDDDDLVVDECGVDADGISLKSVDISPDHHVLTTLQRINSDHCYCPETASWLDPSSARPQQRNAFVMSKSKLRLKTEHSLMYRSPRHALGSRGKLTGTLKGGRRKTKDVTGARSSRYFSHRSREKREQLNQMERDRRIGLKTCFERLRVVVPETSGNVKASKDKILLYARAKIRCLESTARVGDEELEKLKKENEELRMRLKRIIRDLRN